MIITIMTEWYSGLHGYADCVENISPYLGSYFFSALIIGMASAVIVLLFLLIAEKCKSVWNVFNRYLVFLFGVVWMFGFVVYDVGMYTGCRISIISNMPMAVVHAFGMFVLDSDVSAIHDNFHANTVFMACFSAAHFLAAFISLVFVIKHFGYNVVADLRLFFKSSCLSGKNKMTYMFWGMNDATYTLAKSIKKHHDNNHDDDYRIVVIRTNYDTDTSTAKNGMNRLFNFLSLKNIDLERLQELECLTTSTFFNMVQLPSVHVKDNRYLKFMGLKRIEKLITRTTDGVHVFFLSEDEATNIRSVSILKNDRTLRNFANVKFYCHSRFNSINRVVEDFDVEHQISVRIIDSSHLSIECLKRESCHQPIRFVDIDKAGNIGTVRSKFTSLIVGFGTTGKDALRFLYEYGAFVDYRSSEKVFRSPFCCHIVDKDMANLNGNIINASPQVFANVNVESAGGENLVNMYNFDYDSDEFYNSLLERISQDLNYVVIAIGNDEEGITLAVRIMKSLRRQKRDFSKLRIFVRSYKPSILPYLEKIRDHYNEGEERIVIFGSLKDIFTYDMVVSNYLEERGKQYYNAYRALNPDFDDDGSWEQRRRKLTGLTTLKKVGKDEITKAPIFEETYLNPPQVPTLADLQKLRRKETQDKSNTLHEATKLYVLQQVCSSWLTDLLPQVLEFVKHGDKTITIRKRVSKYDVSPKTVLYPEMSPANQMLMDNLAKLEHIRWNASHEVLGYSPMPASVPDDKRGCDETLALHNCLVPWEELDSEADKISYVDDYKIYDYSVVETTMALYCKSKEQE